MELNDFTNIFQNHVSDHIKLFEDIYSNAELSASVEQAVRLIVGAMKNKNKLMICGNGGSAADAQHMAAEFLGRFAFDRAPLPAMTLTSDTSTLTCISNDYSYEDVFSRQVYGLGHSGDILLGISTSGSSLNILKAFKAAKECGVKCILLTSKRVIGDLDGVELAIKVPSSKTALIQEAHLFIEHYICGAVEFELLG